MYSVVAVPVFSYVLEKVSRWELPSLHLPRREFSSPLSGRHLSASHSRMACGHLSASHSRMACEHLSVSHSRMACEHLSASHSRMAATRCHSKSCDTLGVTLSGSSASPTGAALSGSSASPTGAPSGSSASPTGAGVVLSGSSASPTGAFSGSSASPTGAERSGTSASPTGAPLSGLSASPTGAALSGTSASPTGAPFSGLSASPTGAEHSGSSASPTGAVLSGTSASPTGAPSGSSASPTGAEHSGTSASPTGAVLSGTSASPTGAPSGSSASPTGAEHSGSSASPTGAVLSGTSASPTGAPSGSSASPTGAEHSGTSASPTGAVLSGTSASPTGAPSGSSASPTGAEHSGSSASPTGAVLSGTSASPTGAPSGSSASPTGAEHSGSSASPTGALLSGASTSPTGALSGSSASPTGAEHSGTSASASPTGAEHSGTSVSPTEEETLFNDIVDLLMSPHAQGDVSNSESYDSNTALYTPCNCRECNCNFSLCNCKPCPNAWFDWRSEKKTVSLLSLFEKSTLKNMLCYTKLTAATVLKIFGLTLPTCGSILHIELLLRHLQNQYKFTIVCEDCSTILSTFVASGGGRKRKSNFTRRKNSKNVPDNLLDVTKAENDDADDTILLEHADESVSETVNENSEKSKQAKYRNSEKGKASEERYRSSDQGKSTNSNNCQIYSQKNHGKDARNSANKTYSKKEYGKDARNTACKTYSKKDYGKDARNTACKTYSKKDYGKDARNTACKTYSKKDYGKDARNSANKTYSKKGYGKDARNSACKTYSKKDYGKDARNSANKTYSKKGYGKDARNSACKTYSKKDYGRAARYASNKSYSFTDKRRASWKRNRNSKYRKEYMKGYMTYFRKCEKINIDFSTENAAGNTKNAQVHVIRPEFTQNYDQCKSQILKGRCMLSAPEGYTTGSMKNANAFYKLTLANMLHRALEKLQLDNDSWETIPGISKKALKSKHFNLQNKAAMFLAELAWFKRQQCITALKIQQNRLSSLAEAITSKMAIQEKNFDQKVALLGLQGHKKSPEPFHTNVSYADGIPYNYVAEAAKFEEAKSSDKKNRLHITYKCNNICILPDEEDLTNLRDIFDECAKLGEKRPHDFRRFLQKFQWCTKWHEFPEEEKNDLNPNRMYLFPVKHRNHPEECYIPQKGKNYPSPHTKCRSQEVTIRKLMVHFEKPRKFYSIISKAITAHKLLCDIDASTIMGDVEYLAKLVKIKLTYDNASVGFSSQSEARQWTADSIEEHMTKVVVKGKTPKTTFSHRDVFDRNRCDLPSIRCYCCNKLATPKQSSTIDLNTAKKLKYDPLNGKIPHPVFEQLQNFLVEKGIIAQNSGDSETNELGDEFKNHPTRMLHGLAICNSCRNNLNKGEVPAHSMINGMYTGETPQVLKVLNPIEQMFVSKVKCFQTIIKPGPISSKLPQSERLTAIKGNLIHLPLSTSTTAEQLCKSATERLFDVEDYVHCYGKPKKDKTIWRHLVDRKKVHAALSWLVKNNKNYKDIVVPAVAEDILPDVFGEDPYICKLCQQQFDSESEQSKHEKSCTEARANSPDYSNSSEPLNSGTQLSDCNQCSAKSSKKPDSSNTCPVPEEDALNSSLSLRTCNFCQKIFDTDSQCKTHKNECISEIYNSSDGWTSQDSENEQGNLPWIEQVPKESLHNAFRQFTVVNKQSKETEASEVFKMLKIDSKPVPYYELNLDCDAFPDRYPYGTGGLTAFREKQLTDTTFEQTRLMTADNYHRRNLQYLFHLTGQKEKRLIKGGIFSVQNKNFKSLSKKDIANGAQEKNTELLKRITSVLTKLPSQREFWNNVRSKVEAMVFDFGPPTFWATFSPGEYDDEEMLKYLRERNSDLPDVEKMTVSQLVCKDPILAGTYLQTKFDATLKFLLSDANPIGKIKHHFVRTEYQTRLMPHFHCFFWVEDAPIIGQDSDEAIFEFIGKHISCKLPSPNEDPLMHGFVKKYQLHRCNSYCLRRPKNSRGKARCKFGFPRAACMKPILHGVATSIASHKTGTYKKRLYELARKQNEQFINDYNPVLLYLWQGNVDLQFIGENSESLVEYICKYATKAPKSAITDFDMNAMKNEKKSTWAQLFKLSIQMMKDRELGAMEARNFMLSENPIKTNASFLYVNAVYASKRKSMLKNKQHLQALPDDSNDIFYGDLIGTWYPKRPKYDRSGESVAHLDTMSLYDFAMTYERFSNSAASKLVDKSKLLVLANNAGYMKRRVNDPIKQPLVVYGPSHIDPIKDSEAYYFSFLLLHKPFRHEALLMGTSASYKLEFDQLKEQLPAMAEHEEKFRSKKNFREIMEKDAEANAQDMEANAATASDAENIVSGSDFFETVRKHTSIETEEQLKNAISGLSPDQLAVYNLFVENVDHYYKHKTQTCSCEKFEPIRLFVSGFGGSGKSHLIRTLMAYQYIRSEVNKEPCHFLLGAPTGIASYNIGGMTLHSMWNLPVDHNDSKSVREYRKLNSGQINKMRANYVHACGLIIDEVSMISNQMLMAINMRMSEVIGSKEIEAFGGMPIVVFGDLFQLEPVGGCQPFVPLSSNIAKKMFGGFPCIPNLWEGFQFRQLNTNHRQQGEENKRWRAVLSHVRFATLTSADVDYLNERIIATSGCKTPSDLLNQYVTTFLECEEAGMGPVCLLPENKMSEEFNNAVMKRKGQVPTRIAAIDRFACPKDRLQSVKNVLAGLETKQTGGLDQHLDIAINTRVMLRVNDKRNPGLVNGARGAVHEIISSGNVVTKILIKFDDIEEVQTIERAERKFQVLPKCFVYRKMFPLINSYAMTIHKSQSLSLPCVFADLGNKIFADGMSYVAVSRCLSHKGLYLINFNPAKVIASDKACNEYRRLLGKGRIHSNQSCKQGKLECQWYTPSVQKRVTKITREKMNHTATEKQKTKEGGPLPSKSSHCTDPNARTKGKARKRKAQDASEKKSDKKAKPAEAQKGDASKRQASNNPDPCNSKKSKVNEPNSVPTMKEKLPKCNPTPSETAPPASSIIVTSAFNRPFDYVPVDEQWQRSICLAFGWTFVRRSCGEGVTNAYGLPHKTRPKRSTIRGDGNCWYRSIAHIVTGCESNYVLVKNSLINFMQANIDALQQLYTDLPHLIGNDRDYPFDNTDGDYAQKVIDHHNKRNKWSKNVTMEMTSVMLKTKFYIYDLSAGWSNIDSGHCPFWAHREFMAIYPETVDVSCIPDLGEQSMYIAHPNSNHFDTCHTGLYRN